MRKFSVKSNKLFTANAEIFEKKVARVSSEFKNKIVDAITNILK